MILDLLSLHLLCTDNKGTLEQMKIFDMSKITKAKDSPDAHSGGHSAVFRSKPV